LLQSETRKLPLTALAFGHFVIDMQSSGLAVLIPIIYAQLQLQYAAAAAIMTVQALTSSVIQPLFGVVSDRRPMRTVLPVACVLAALGTGTAVLMPAYGLVLAVVVLSGLGSALYHAAGSLHSYHVSGDRKATGMSVFFAGGNLGYATGPLFMVTMLGLFGNRGSLAALVPGTLGALGLLILLSRFATTAEWQERKAHLQSTQPSTGVRQWSVVRALGIVVLVISFRSVVQVGLVTFIPLYFTSLQPGNEGYAALLLSVFVFAGAAGTIVGGPLADRIGRKPLMIGSMVLVLPMLFVFLYGPPPAQIFSIAMAGASLISASALTVVIAQELLPHNIGLASGLTLGLGFGAGGVGAALLGAVGDRYGLPTTMHIIALLPIALVLLSLLLPSTGRRAEFDLAPEAPDAQPAG
jgi:MFS transporter, FSR family, fosmidomycin resistance protein